MSFVRTSYGLSNQHLFHNVDYIIFVEGGESFTKIQIDHGAFNEESIDVLFWSKIFSNYASNSNFKVKAVGSKTAVIKVAEDIVENNLTSVYAAMDKDFDEILGKMYKHDNVLYTFGYSWENDVWNENVIKEIINTTSAKNVDPALIIEPFEKFIKDIKFPVYSDGYLFTKGNSFFPRPKNHLKLVDCSLRSIPGIKKVEILKIINDKALNKSNIYSFGARKKICCRTYCYGHLLGDFSKLLIHYILKTKYNVGGISEDIIKRIALSVFLNHMSVNIDSYYRAILN